MTLGEFLELHFELLMCPHPHGVLKSVPNVSDYKLKIGPVVRHAGGVVLDRVPRILGPVDALCLLANILGDSTHFFIILC